MNKKALEILKADVQEVLKGQRGLRLRFRNEIPFQIWGTFQIYDDLGALQGSFDIEVTIPANYPYGFPILKETSDKIERVIARHISTNGFICEEIDQKEMIIASKGITIKEYFDHYVFKHLCWQLVYEEEGNKNLQEWSHFGDGILQFYLEALTTNDPAFVEACLKRLVSNSLPGRNDACLCGSDKKAKYCHLEQINEIKRINRKKLEKDLLIVQQQNIKAA